MKEPLFKVPIRNLFYLISYAYHLSEFRDSLNTVDGELITLDFIVEQFNKRVNHLLQRGTMKNYITEVEETNRISGRLLVNESMVNIVMKKPVVLCEKDIYSSDIKENQIIKTTLEQIVNKPVISETVRRKSYLLLERLVEVRSIPLSREVFKKLKFSRFNYYYKFAIHLAWILHECQLLSHKSGDLSLFHVTLDDISLNQLFEKFLLGFYQREQTEYKVKSEQIHWNLVGNRAFLPTMQTDISMTHKYRNEKIIIDAKFYKNMFQEHYSSKTFHSHNMYQLFTYLMHQPKHMKLRGILIYPFNGVHVNEVYTHGENMTMEIMTVDLSAEWEEIYRQLVGIIEFEN